MSNSESRAFAELLGAEGTGRLIGVSRTEVYELHKAELIPMPVHLKGKMRWRLRELIDWIDSGCPHRGEWRWRPVLPVKLDTLIAIRKDEIAGLQQELTELKARLGAGESCVHVR